MPWHNELREINDVFEVGDEFVFELNHLDNSNDINLQLLVNLIKHIEKTTNSLANLNKMDLNDFDEKDYLIKCVNRKYQGSIPDIFFV